MPPITIPGNIISQSLRPNSPNSSNPAAESTRLRHNAARVRCFFAASKRINATPQALDNSSASNSVMATSGLPQPMFNSKTPADINTLYTMVRAIAPGSPTAPAVLISAGDLITAPDTDVE
ncbi:hypothetical protein D3C80_1678910 [compost metagenome]